MSTLLKAAMTATIAVGVSVTPVGLKLVRAEASPYRSDVSRVDSPISSVISTPSRSTIRKLAEPLQTNFDPEPNDPPKSSGGLGTR